MKDKLDRELGMPMDSCVQCAARRCAESGRQTTSAHKWLPVFHSDAIISVGGTHMVWRTAAQQQHRGPGILTSS